MNRKGFFLSVVTSIVLSALACNVISTSSGSSNSATPPVDISDAPNSSTAFYSDEPATVETLSNDYSVGLTYYNINDLGDEIPQGWVSYDAGLWLMAEKTSAARNTSIQLDGEIDFLQLAPLQDGSSGAYVVTQDGIKYPVDVVAPRGTPFGIRYESVLSIEINQLIPAGVPFNGVWVGQFFAFSRYSVRFLVPENMTPSRLVFPLMQTSINLPELYTIPGFPILSLQLPGFPISFQTSEKVLTEISTPQLKIAGNSVIVNFPVEITNTDQTSQHTVSPPIGSLLDSYGLFWKRGDCEYPYSIGPGLTVNGTYCFIAPFFNEDGFSDLPTYWVLTIASDTMQEANEYLVMEKDMETENCIATPKNLITDTSDYGKYLVYALSSNDLGRLNIPAEFDFNMIRADANPMVWEIPSHTGEDYKIKIETSEENDVGWFDTFIFGPDGKLVEFLGQICVGCSGDDVDYVIVNSYCDNFFYLVFGPGEGVVGDFRLIVKQE
jgi:hypothetical protein